MKHIFSFLLVICLLAISFVFSNNEAEMLSYFKTGQCEFVVSKNVDTSFLPKDAKVVVSGDNVIITFHASLARYIYHKVGEPKGIVFKFEGDFDSLNHNLNLKYFKDKKIKNENHYYAFSNKFERFVFVNGKKINMHIVEKDNMLVVGFPIILTSY